jgi:hypothetical protein
MAFWQRFLITILVMLAAGFAAGLIWRSVFDTAIPGYFSGLVGGMTALPAWELLKRVNLKDKR